MDLDKLYHENKGLVWKWARQYAGICADRADVDVEDLAQAGFIGMLDAVETYDPERGAWSAWASYYIRTAMLDVLGFRSNKNTYTVIAADGTEIRRHHVCISLDAPAYGDDDCDVSLMETTADDSIPDVHESLFASEDARMIRAAVADLEKTEVRQAATEHYLRGKPLATIALERGITPRDVQNMCRRAIRKLSVDRRIRAIYNERRLDAETRFTAHKGIKGFWNSRSSIVEDAVIWREENRARNGMA